MSSSIVLDPVKLADVRNVGTNQPQKKEDYWFLNNNQGLTVTCRSWKKHVNVVSLKTFYLEENPKEIHFLGEKFTNTT